MKIGSEFSYHFHVVSVFRLLYETKRPPLTHWYTILFRSWKSCASCEEHFSD